MKNRFGSILLSIVIAFGLWLYVITYVSPNSEETYYNIPVVLEGESVLNERGLMCTSTSSSTVSLQLAGARSDLIKVNQNNITVKANLSAITEPGQKINLRYTISYPGNVAQNAFETLSQSDFYVDVEYRRVKDVPVVVQYDGTRSEDYLYDTENVQLDYSTVNIIGPRLRRRQNPAGGDRGGSDRSGGIHQRKLPLYPLRRGGQPPWTRRRSPRMWKRSIWT